MPTLSMNKKKMSNKKKQVKRTSKRTSSAGASHQIQYARLLADPCTAPLVAPQYGASDGGYLTKFSNHRSFQTGSSNTGGNSGSAGYCVWYPDYSGDTGSSGGGNGNLYIYGGPDASTQPTNSTAVPLGNGSFGSTGGAFLQDPATAFVDTDIVQDCRTAAACIKFLYTGRSDALSGRVGYLEGVPREALLTGTVGGPPNVNNLFRYSNNTVRMPMHSLENKFRPGDGSQSYRQPADLCFEMGTTSVSVATLGSGTTSGTGLGIGFVWEGLQDDSSISFDFLKAIEWRPEMSSQLVSPPASVAPGGGNMVSRAMAFLDRVHPGWERQAYSAVTSAVTSAGTQKLLGYAGETALALLPVGI